MQIAISEMEKHPHCILAGKHAAVAVLGAGAMVDSQVYALHALDVMEEAVICACKCMREMYDKNWILAHWQCFDLHG